MDWMILYPLLLLIVLLPKCVFFLKLSSALQPIYLTAYLTFLLLSLKSWTCDLLSCLWNSRIFFCIANASTIYLFLHTRYLRVFFDPFFPPSYYPSTGVFEFCHLITSWISPFLTAIFLVWIIISSWDWGPHISTCSVLDLFLHNLTRLKYNVHIKECLNYKCI